MVVTSQPIDADNHYYEALDAFTRHLDPKFRERGVRPVQEGKRVRILIGGKVNTFIPNPTFNPIISPDASIRSSVGRSPRTSTPGP